jgi:phosphotransacetylase
MIIMIESVYGDVLVSGKVSSAGQLKSRMMKVINCVDLEDFVSVFCAWFGYHRFAYDADVVVDYVIDLDVYRVYRPLASSHDVKRLY